MKKCPFCAEEIQDEAIKCRYCGSALTGKPGDAPAPALTPATKGPVDVARKLLYEGSPSWKTYLGHYLLAGFGALVLMAVLKYGYYRNQDSIGNALISVVIPLAALAVYITALNLIRKSLKFRVTNTVIEIERGLLSKRIDVLQLWRVQDVSYRQNLMDRILGIAHIDVLSHDPTTPKLEVTGLPASRELFEQLRDSIEIQRQGRNVVGVVS